MKGEKVLNLEEVQILISPIFFVLLPKKSVLDGIMQLFNNPRCPSGFTAVGSHFYYPANLGLGHPDYGFGLTQ